MKYLSSIIVYAVIIYFVGFKLFFIGFAIIAVVLYIIMSVLMSIEAAHVKEYYEKH